MLQQSFEGMCSLDLQIEGEGSHGDFLRCHMCQANLTQPCRQGQKKLQRTIKGCIATPTVTVLKRTHPVPSQAKWATYFRILPSDLLHNVEVIQAEMTRKAYARSRWKPQLVQHLTKWGVDTQL